MPKVVTDPDHILFEFRAGQGGMIWRGLNKQGSAASGLPFYFKEAINIRVQGKLGSIICRGGMSKVGAVAASKSLELIFDATDVGAPSAS